MWKKLAVEATFSPGARRFAPGDQAAEEWREFVQTFDFFALIRAWPELVGTDLGGKSTPLRLRQHTLFILTRHPTVSDALNWMSVPLRQKIVQKFPALAPMVERLAFETNESFFLERHSKVAEKPARVALHPMDPRLRRLRAEAESLFASVEDPAEKERWVSLYVQSAQAE